MKAFIRFSLILGVASASMFADQVTIAFTDLPGHIVNNEYVGYSGATITDGVQTLTGVNVLCDDFSHTTYFPSGPFTYNVSTIPTLANARFTAPDELANYEVAAILLSEYNSAGGSALNSFDTGSYQFALWKLFTPGAGDYGNSATLLSDAQTLQATGGGITSQAYADMQVLTPDSQSAGNQEFLRSTPEPASLLLLGSGFLGIGFVGRRIRKG